MSNNKLSLKSGEKELYIFDLISLINHIALNFIPKEKLTFIPAASNYLIENTICDGKIFRKIIKVYGKFNNSNTQLCYHLNVINPRHDCFLQLTLKQVEFIDSLC